MDIDTKLIFTRYVELNEGEAPTLIRFEYDKLRKFCRRCGYMKHENILCQEIIVHPMLPIVKFPGPVNVHHKEDNPDNENDEMELQEHQANVNQNMYEADDIMHLQHEGNIGEGNNEEVPQLEAPHESAFIKQSYEDPMGGRSLPLTIREVGSSFDRGSTRKAEAHGIDDLNPSTKQRMEGQWSGEGLLVPLEPP